MCNLGVADIYRILLNSTPSFPDPYAVFSRLDDRLNCPPSCIKPDMILLFRLFNISLLFSSIIINRSILFSTVVSFFLFKRNDDDPPFLLIYYYIMLEIVMWYNYYTILYYTIFILFLYYFYHNTYWGWLNAQIRPLRIEVYVANAN
jgi:hypothetical protein